MKSERVLGAAQVERLLREPVVVEEKVDGANVGISLDADGGLRVQSRGHVLTPGNSHPQFHPLKNWTAVRADVLRQALETRYILFGEWLFARHTVAYDALPDYFLAHDLFDRERGVFLDTNARARVARAVEAHEVPRLFAGVLGSVANLQRLLGRSRFSAGVAEGAYLRLEANGVLQIRAKFVRPGWVPTDELHWSKRRLERNGLSGEAA